MSNNINENVKEKNNDSKAITILSVCIMTIVVAIAGATFAFFQATATASNISGNSAYVATPLSISITHVTNSSVGTKKLIPQIDEDIQMAVTGSTNGSCVDSNGNAVCKVYSITVENKTETNYYLTGEITFSTDPTTTASTGMPNLKWAKGTNATAGFPTTATGPFYSTFNTFVANPTSTTQTTTLSDTFSITKKDTVTDSQTFYVVVWISETGSVQSDNGKFTGTVTFTGYSDEGKELEGITSTIRS